jgi:hypothetical protein
MGRNETEAKRAKEQATRAFAWGIFVKIVKKESWLITFDNVPLTLGTVLFTCGTRFRRAR